MDVATLVPTELNPNIPVISPGDTVKVSVKVVEGERVRSQVFQGVVIRVRKGSVNANFTVRRVAYGVGVERTFFLYSPSLEKVEVLRHAKVRRAKLYYLRGLTAKKARLKERRPKEASKKVPGEALEEAPAAELEEAPEED
jgi:large subunit ribosomal protein L19